MEVSFHPYFHYVNIKVKQNSLASLNKTSDNEIENSCRRYFRLSYASITCFT